MLLTFRLHVANKVTLAILRSSSKGAYIYLRSSTDCLRHERCILSGPRRVLSDLFHVGIRVRDELHDLVSIFAAFAAKHADILVLTDNPGVLEHLLDAHAIGWVFLEQACSEILSFLTYRAPNSMVEIDIVLRSLPSNLMLVVRVERQVPSQQQVDDHSERPAIYTLVVGLLR